MTGKFNFGRPLLGSRDFSSQMSTIEQMQAELEQKKAAILQARQQMEQQQQNQQAPQSRTPIWDEIDSICAGMSEKEFAIVSGERVPKARNHIAAIIQQAQLEMLRPIIESSQQGRDALDRHLVKRLKKTASKEVDDELNDFKEYREKYAQT